MCLFPRKNTNYRSIAYKKGLAEFSCGHCPECLGARSSHWALRSVMQAKESKKCCMITLTYDDFVYDNNGNIIGENLNLRRVDKRDCQLFIKRLREHFDRVFGVKDVKYLLTAEYGKRTHRPHYHALLFGVEFNDLIFHKKSKRGNTIYRSPTLDKLWKHGICTVDSNRMSSAIAKYCTKYCAKDFGAEDTFMLVSHGLGLNKMLEEFNGKSYWIDGQEYPIPRIVWQRYISGKYHTTIATYKYVNKPKDFNYISPVLHLNNKFIALSSIDDSCYIYIDKSLNGVHKKVRHLFKQYLPYACNKDFKDYLINRERRSVFRYIRDNDEVYKTYIQYWKEKSLQKLQLSVESRINLLDDRKYHIYKAKAKQAIYAYKVSGYNTFVVPRKENRYTRPKYDLYTLYLERHLPVPSRHIRANDRKKVKARYLVLGNEVITDIIPKQLRVLSVYNKQISLFDKK